MRRQSFLLVCPIVILCGTVALAEPTITGLSMHGLRRGGTTRLVITGTNLLPDPHIVLPFPVSNQQMVGDGKNGRVVIDLDLDERSSIGIHQLRLATRRGISNPMAVSVDGLDQMMFGDRIESLPIALSGTISGTQILKTSFTGRRGESIVVEVEAKRIGAGLRPVVRLMDPAGRQIAWSGARAAIGGDARAEAVLESDGEFTVQLHDSLYRVPAPGFFRLKVGDFQYADLAFPLAVQHQTATSIELVSTNVPSSFGLPLKSEDDWLIGSRGAALDNIAPLFSGSLPYVMVSDHRELVEDASASDPQSLAAAPVAVSGRIATPGEVDRYSLDVKPGDKLRFDVLADRLGSSLDGVLIVRDGAGKELARNDDRPRTSDPGVDVTVPAGTTQLVVTLKDLQEQAGEDSIYRLSVENLSQPDFSLTLDADRVNVPAGGSQVIRVTAVRRRYGGPIDLEVLGLPAEIQVAGNRIPAGGSIALLTLTSSEASPQSGWAAVVGRAAKPGLELVRRAEFAKAPGADRQPWFRSELGLARSEPSSLSLEWNITAGPQLLQGVNVPLHAKITRRDQAAGPVRLRLLTTQVMPRKKVKKNNKDVEVNDVDRAIRLAAAVVLDGQTAEADTQLMVPADLSNGPWSVVLVAERLSSDKKTVLATAVTGVKTFAVESPIAIDLEADNRRIEGKAGTGETGIFAGRVRRAEGFDLPVTVSLTSLPKEIPAPSTVVPPGTDAFSLAVSFPYGTKLGELKGAKLVATALPDPKNAALLVRSNEIPVTVDVVAGEKPAAEKPLTVFEDEAEFVAYLTEGDGQAELDSGEKYSGAAGLKVTPGQRFNPAIPTLGIKIRQNPGPGEYRYLRFAWRKVGGRSVCLQLNHDGIWGPGGMARAGAKFRYHAGPGDECFGASVEIDKAIPTKFAVVTRDLFADFGEFTLTGLAFAAVDGRYAVFDHLYLAQNQADFDAHSQ